MWAGLTGWLAGCIVGRMGKLFVCRTDAVMYYEVRGVLLDFAVPLVSS